MLIGDVHPSETVSTYLNAQATGSLPLPSTALVRVAAILPCPPVFSMAVTAAALVVITPLPPAAAAVFLLCGLAALVSTMSIALSVAAAAAAVVPIAIVVPAGAPGVTPFPVGVTGRIAVAIPVLRTPAITGLRTSQGRDV